jgi:hypothetical protein
MFNIQKLPEVNFFCQQVNLPGITLGVPEFGNPFNNAPIPGESLTYDTLNVQFLIDDSLVNYKAIYNWIVALGFPEDYQQYLNFLNNQDFLRTSELAKNFSDATLTILGANNQPVQTVAFHDMFPVALDSLMFQSTNQDVTYLVGNATFRYAYYKFA